MNKIFALICTLVISIMGFAQSDSIQFEVQPDGRFLCKGKDFIVINIPDNSAETLYESIKSGCYKCYNNPETYISGVDNNVISVSAVEFGWNENVMMIPIPNHLHYEIRIECRDGRVKVSPWATKVQEGTSVTNYSWEYYASTLFKNGVLKPKKKKMFDGANKIINSAIRTILKNSFENKDKPSDDW